jgi:hypothetical protein
METGHSWFHSFGKQARFITALYLSLKLSHILLPRGYCNFLGKAIFLFRSPSPSSRVSELEASEEGDQMSCAALANPLRECSCFCCLCCLVINGSFHSKELAILPEFFCDSVNLEGHGFESTRQAPRRYLLEHQRSRCIKSHIGRSFHKWVIYEADIFVASFIMKVSFTQDGCRSSFEGILISKPDKCC